MWPGNAFLHVVEAYGGFSYRADRPQFPAALLLRKYRGLSFVRNEPSDMLVLREPTTHV